MVDRSKNTKRKRTNFLFSLNPQEGSGREWKCSVSTSFHEHRICRKEGNGYLSISTVLELLNWECIRYFYASLFISFVFPLIFFDTSLSLLNWDMWGDQMSSHISVQECQMIHIEKRRKMYKEVNPMYKFNQETRISSTFWYPPLVIVTTGYHQLSEKRNKSTII